MEKKKTWVVNYVDTSGKYQGFELDADKYHDEIDVYNYILKKLPSLKISFITELFLSE